MTGRIAALRARAAGGLEERLALMAPSRRLRLALAEAIAISHLGERQARVLEAGSGDGLIALAIAGRHPGWTVVGFDLSEDLVALSRRRAGERRLGNVSFAVADLTQPLPESGFDVVLAIECLSEIPEDGLAIRSMATALAPGGLMVVQVPERSWRPILPGSPPRWRHEVRHGYNSEEIAIELKRAGLVDVFVEPTYRATAVVAQEIRDRVKETNVILRAMLFPFLAAAVRLERWGLTWGRPRALLAAGRLG